MIKLGKFPVDNADSTRFLHLNIGDCFVWRGYSNCMIGYSNCMIKVSETQWYCLETDSLEEGKKTDLQQFVKRIYLRCEISLTPF